MCMCRTTELISPEMLQSTGGERRTANAVSVTHAKFEYVPVTEILGFTPRFGPASGGTRIVVTVNALPQLVGIDGGISCRFTAEDISSSMLSQALVQNGEGSSPELVCFSPATAIPQLLSLEIVVAGVDMTFSNSKFLVYPTPYVTEVRPVSAYEGGGTTITVHGSGFSNTNAMFCRFGENAVRAKWLAGSLMECVVPPAEGPGQVSVDITLNGVDYTSSRSAITYVMKTILISAAPLTGSAIGGTVVHATGVGFTSLSNSSEPPVCVFGQGPSSIHVVAHVFTETSARCLSPRSPNSLSKAPSKHSNMHAVSFRVLSADVLRSNSDYFASVEGVLDDPKDASGASSPASLTFVFIAETMVTSVHPAFGHMSGGDVVNILGAGIPASLDYVVSCVFSDLSAQSTPTIVPGSRVDSSTIQCITPAVGSSGVATLRLSVTKHSQEEGASDDTATVITTTSVQYTFHGDISIVSAAPTIGPELGGTVVTISLDREAGLFSFIPLACKFGDLPEVPASYSGSNGVQCTSPSNAPGVVSLVLKTKGRRDAHINESGHSFGETISFVYHDTLTVASLSPTEAVSSGGSRIEIHGTNFVNTSMLSCRFGKHAIVAATFESEHVMSCIAPAITAELARTSSSVAARTSIIVAVSVNGFQWSDDCADNAASHPRLTILAGYSSIVSLSPARGPMTGGTGIEISLSSNVSPSYVRSRCSAVLSFHGRGSQHHCSCRARLDICSTVRHARGDEGGEYVWFLDGYT